MQADLENICILLLVTLTILCQDLIYSAYEFIPCVATKDTIVLSLRFLSPLTGPAGQ